MTSSRKSIPMRDSNIELLRILAIGLVITSHFNLWSFDVSSLPLEFNVNVLLKFLLTAGCIANIIFILISGYFLVKSHLKYQKVIALILEMYFYSILCLCLAKFVFNVDVSGSKLLSSFLPFPLGNWFMVSYIILYLLSPFLNKLITVLDKRGLMRLIIVCFVLFSVMPIVTGWSFLSSFSIFPLVYFIGAYVRLYVGRVSRNSIIKWIIVFSLLIVFSIALLYLLAIVTDRHILMDHAVYFLAKNYSPLVIIMGTLIFLLFRDISMKPSRLINALAASVLGVYLIHENVFMRGLIWKGEFLPIDIIHTDTAVFILLAAVKICIVLTACLLIDRLRILLFGGLERKMSELIYAKGRILIMKVRSLVKRRMLARGRG